MGLLRRLRRRVPVEAVRVDDVIRLAVEDPTALPPWLQELLNRGHIGVVTSMQQVFIKTKTGNAGDWVIRNEDGRVDIASPDDLDKTFESLL